MIDLENIESVVKRAFQRAGYTIHPNMRGPTDIVDGRVVTAITRFIPENWDMGVPEALDNMTFYEARRCQNGGYVVRFASWSSLDIQRIDLPSDLIGDEDD